MSTRNAIVVEGISKNFGEVEALKKVSFRVPVGAIFGYLGPNAAGKTTTVRIMLGLITPDEGNTRIFGFSANDEDARKNIGAVLELPGVYDGLSARENLEFYAQLFGVPRESRTRRIEDLLRAVGLSKRKDDLVRTFSKGMKQRLATARSLVHNPRVLIFDEPTAGLDPASQKGIREMIVDLAHKEGKTVFLCSHNLDEVQKICSHVAILNRGKLMECNTVEMLRKKFTKPTLIVITSGLKNKAKLIEGIRKLDIVEDCRIKHERLTVFLKNERGSEKVIRFLSMRGVNIREAKLELSTLEDVYFSITGGEE